MSPLDQRRQWTRREFLKVAGSSAVMAFSAGLVGKSLWDSLKHESVFLASVGDYGADLKGVLLAGLAGIGVLPAEVRGRHVLLKPNLVEPHAGRQHINVHPLVVRGAVEAFLSLGAASVTVGEGAGHRRDTQAVLHDSGFAEILAEDRIRFVDLNMGPVVARRNLGRTTNLDYLHFPAEVAKADIVVSIAKMKTHHWAGVTLSMKNLFGVMPGILYGWPKNVLHWEGIPNSIYDINATLKPHLGIVDGIVGMDGDGPIMGDPVSASVLAVGRDLVALDATCARVMGIDPLKIPYLAYSGRFGGIGVLAEGRIDQRGETIASVRKDFQLLDLVPAQRGIRL